MLYLEETIRRMMWRTLFPTKFDAVKVETIHRASGTRVLLKIEESNDTNRALDVTVTSVATNSYKAVRWEEKEHVDISGFYLKPGSIGCEHFAALQYCIMIAVRRMCAKHDQEMK